MPNPFYNQTGVPGNKAPGASAAIRAEFALISAGFSKVLPSIAGSANKLLAVNPTEDGLTVATAIDGYVIGGTTPAAATFTNIAFASAVIAAGSVGAPSLAFAGSLTTGIYQPAANQIGFAVGGVQEALLSAAGFTSAGNLVAKGANATVSGLTAVSMGVVSGVSPQISMVYSAGATDSKVWDSFADGTTLHFRAINDAASSATEWMSVVRAGLAVSSVNFPNSPVVMGSTLSVPASATIGNVVVGNTLNVSGLTSLQGLIVGQGLSAAGISSSGLSINRPSIGSGQNAITFNTGGSVSSWQFYQQTGSPNVSWYNSSSGDVMALDQVGNLSVNGDLAFAGGQLAGYRGVPVGSVNGSLTAGWCIPFNINVGLSTGIPAGTVFAFYNDSASPITCTQNAGLTLRLGGTTSTGNRTLAPRAFASVWCRSTTEYIITGAGVS